MPRVLNAADRAANSVDNSLHTPGPCRCATPRLAKARAALASSSEVQLFFTIPISKRVLRNTGLIYIAGQTGRITFPRISSPLANQIAFVNRWSSLVPRPGNEARARSPWRFCQRTQPLANQIAPHLLLYCDSSTEVKPSFQFSLELHGASQRRSDTVELC